MPRSCLLLLLLPLVVAASPAASERHRVVIMTDMTHDDGNSLIRYLYYAPLFDTEAIIVTPQLPDYRHDEDGPWLKAQGILDAYRQELPQLRRHDPRFPSYESLQAVTKRGRGALPIIWLTETRTFSGQIGDRTVTNDWGPIRFGDWIGEGTTPHGEPKDSEGSEFLQTVFARDDDRPIFVQLWSGPITFVQALERYRTRQGPEKFAALLAKLHVYSIHLQDITVDYFLEIDALRGQPCSHLGETRSSYAGPRVHPRWFLFDFAHFWKYLQAMPPAQVAGHGPMSALYDGGGEGDTPAFLYLISAALGLNDPLEPTHGSWGNQFFPLGGAHPEGYYHTCPGKEQNLMRWLPDTTHSFLARLQWSVREPGQVNREPVAVLNGDRSRAVLHRTVRPGTTLELDASASHDPDGDSLRFHWFALPTPESADALPLPDSTASRLRLPIPVALDRPVHLVLEVRDQGTPELVSYRRIILTPSR
jgi:hypothetical protein